MSLQFPKNFIWGAATSSYQVEGNNTNADWWPWEIATNHERSGEACRHYEFYEQDFDLAKSLHHNAHRLSIEWSRIEPVEGQFSQKELDHYIAVILALRARGIEPLVTLHHFTNPIWFSQKGGWTRKENISAFLRYADFVVQGLAKHVHYWMTINEPTVYFSHSFLWGVWPPQEKSVGKSLAVFDNLAQAHIATYRAIHAIYQKSNLPAPEVSIAQHLQAFVACDNTFRNRFAAGFREKWYNFLFIDKVFDAGTLDFLGVNFYSRQQVDLKGWGFKNLTTDVCTSGHDPVKKNSLGWDIYPQGLHKILLKVKKYNLPVIITENGICTLDDDLRWEYIVAHLKVLHLALSQGVDIRGYLYWSLLDNFEWAQGFGPRFGLIHVDYQTFKRTVKDSAQKLAKVYQAGSLE